MTTEGFFSILERRAIDSGSLLCVGLDPHAEDLETPSAAAARDFCLQLIRATAPYAAAFKPNAAFFEAFGAEGWAALTQVIAAIRIESDRLGSAYIPVILDAKRGDIASTAEAYARSAFEALGADCITASPYLGRDSVEPLTRVAAKGVFLLCKTSNPGSADVQDLPVQIPGRESMPLYSHVAQMARSWNTRGNIGLVVGATFPEILAEVRRITPQQWFLVPGVGEQGGQLEPALAAGLRPDGLGMLINVSRAISRSPDPGRAAAEFRDRIAQARERILRESPPPSTPLSTAIDHVPALVDGLVAAECIRFGSFRLRSGTESPFYIDLRRLISHPALLDQVGKAYLTLLNNLQFDRLAALPYAAIPIATAISLEGGYPMIYPRKEAKEYGTRAEIEGVYHPGETVVLVDDLATTGGSKFEAIDRLNAAGLKVRDVVVLIDRESGARESLESAGLHLHAVMTITKLLDYCERSGKLTEDKIKASREFLRKGA